MLRRRIHQQQEALRAALERVATRKQRRFGAVEVRFAALDLRARVGKLRRALDERSRNLRVQIDRALIARRRKLEAAALQLEERSPFQLLQRGYAIAYDASGKVLRSPDQVALGDDISIRLAQGALDAKVRRKRTRGARYRSIWERAPWLPGTFRFFTPSSNCRSLYDVLTSVAVMGPNKIGEMLNQMNSFLRWAGSKRQIVGELARHCTHNYCRYIEPFAGSACLFFHLQPSEAILADLNGELVSTMRTVRSRVHQVLRRLAELPTGEATYYDIRSWNPAKLSKIDVAARFLYLNHYCFNGLYRTNAQGGFNVPYGPPKSGAGVDRKLVIQASRALRRATLVQSDFEEVALKLGLAIWSTSILPMLSQPQNVHRIWITNVFLWDLTRLGNVLTCLDRRRVRFVITYADSPEARKLFRKWRHRRIQTRRNIAGFAGDRRLSYELLATNFTPGETTMEIDAAHADLHDIPIERIERNPENPRIVFRPAEMETLQESISRHGVQVPISVYRKDKRYVLIDGERRWRCALKLNKKTIPALIQKEPDDLTNLLLMFNIHAMREQWELLTIAVKLPRVIELLTTRFGKAPKLAEISKETGLKHSLINRCKLLIDLPIKFRRDLLEELNQPKSQQKLTEDFFIEMERALKTVERAMPESIDNKNRVREVLIDKYKRDIIRTSPISGICRKSPGRSVCRSNQAWRLAP